MNNKIKNELTEYFEPPKASKKEQFLNSLETYAISNATAKKPKLHISFFLSQILYIRKWVWAVSFIFFASVLFYSKHFEADIIRIVSSFMPILALAVVTESGRSESCGMAELEISAKLSLRYVILARLTIIGITNLLTTLLFFPLILKNSSTDGPTAVICVFCPYLLTSFLGLLLTRKIRGRESAYICTGIAALVSICSITAHNVLPFIFEAAYFMWWLVVTVLLIAGTANELYKKIQMSEELSWSLY